MVVGKLLRLRIVPKQWSEGISIGEENAFLASVGAAILVPPNLPPAITTTNFIASILVRAIP